MPDSCSQLNEDDVEVSKQGSGGLSGANQSQDEAELQQLQNQLAVQEAELLQERAAAAARTAVLSQARDEALMRATKAQQDIHEATAQTEEARLERDDALRAESKALSEAARAKVDAERRVVAALQMEKEKSPSRRSLSGNTHTPTRGGSAAERADNTLKAASDAADMRQLQQNYQEMEEQLNAERAARKAQGDELSEALQAKAEAHQQAAHDLRAEMEQSLRDAMQHSAQEYEALQAKHRMLEAENAKLRRETPPPLDIIISPLTDTGAVVSQRHPSPRGPMRRRERDVDGSPRGARRPVSPYHRERSEHEEEFMAGSITGAYEGERSSFDMASFKAEMNNIIERTPAEPGKVTDPACPPSDDVFCTATECNVRQSDVSRSAVRPGLLRSPR